MGTHGLIGRVATFALPQFTRNVSGTFLICLAMLLPWIGHGQAPGLAWSTNLNARIFAVDANTNIYANSGGTVFQLNSSGVVSQTNVICPRPGIARRDSAGNYYFAGTFDGSQNFGGITIVGGWTNHNGQYAPGYPTCFLAKYSSNGVLQWVSGFGFQAVQNAVTDLELDPAGGAYTAVNAVQGLDFAHIFHHSDAGLRDWLYTYPNTFYVISTKLGGLTDSNCAVLHVRSGDNTSYLSRIDRTGSPTAIGQYSVYTHSTLYINAEPVTDVAGNVLQVGECFNPGTGPCGTQWLRTCAPGTDLAHMAIHPSSEWLLTRDTPGNVYAGGITGQLEKYQGDGTFVWSNNFSQVCVGMVCDASGNRYLNFANGAIGALQADATPQPPTIAQDPLSQTVFATDSVSLLSLALGSAPLNYQWRQNGTNVSGATSTNLTFAAVALSNAGTYVMVVTNSVGGATSAPAVLRVKSVEIYAGAQMLSTGAYTFGSPPTLTIRSAFTGGTTYYTLDGSTPSTSSTPYTGPFQLAQSATVRAIGYSSGGGQSEEADVVNATVFSQHTLTVTTSGDGAVQLNPPGGTYWNTNTVMATAIPGIGSSFLFWLDDASGGNPSATVSMNVDRSLVAVFGTNMPASSPPGLLWRTNLNAIAFAVDTQTNVYANNGGKVFLLNGSGTVVQSNNVCPVPGMARRDSAGNLYFAGSFDGTQNFGGITLVGGWTNHNSKYEPGYPTCFLARYSSNYVLQWVTSFGSQAARNAATDVAVDPAGGAYVGFSTPNSFDNLHLQHLSDSGAREWIYNFSSTFGAWAVKVGGATVSNCCALLFTGANTTPMYRLDRSGNAASFAQFPLYYRSLLCTNGEPLIDDSARASQIGECFNPGSGPCGIQRIRKLTEGSLVWERDAISDLHWSLARDSQSTIYGSGTSGLLARFSNDGDLIWSNYFNQASIAMVTDATDNRFVSFADGSIARLGDDTSSQSFGIGSGPQAQASLSLQSQPQQVWQIQASSNLVSWWVLATITNNSGGIQFSDPSSRKVSRRFYRAVPVP